ncbi:MAG: glycosyltransferase, partial [Elusimicrobiales bacterium]|nr:glycosyltransferase [Elusimicrobiales bacterium]
MKPIQLSIIIPVYNEEKAVTKVINDIKNTVSKIPDIEYEIILINDGSTDNSLQ